MRKSWKVILLTVVIILALFGGAIGYLYFGLHATLQLSIEPVNLTLLADGTYRGQYTHGRFTCVVEVTVEQHIVREIKVLRTPPFTPPQLVAQILEQVYHAQSPAVDTVSGATASSKTILKAIENALKK